MADRKLDLTKDYGTVSPPYQGAVFYQDGAYFRADHTLAWEDQPPTPPKIVTSEVIVADSETGEITTDVVTSEETQLADGDPKIVLTSWLKGDVQLHFQTVRGLVKKGYGETPQTKTDLVNFLVTAGLVPAEQVRIKD